MFYMGCALFFSDMYEWPLGTWGPPEYRTLELWSSTKWPSISIPWLVGAFVLFVSCLCDLSFDLQWKHWLGPIMHSSLTKVSRAAREDSYSSWHLVRAFVILNGCPPSFRTICHCWWRFFVHRWQIIVDDIHSVWSTGRKSRTIKINTKGAPVSEVLMKLQNYPKVS